MNGLNGPRGNNFDADYATKGMSYNNKKANARFL